jgi:hypothetical protein
MAGKYETGKSEKTNLKEHQEHGTNRILGDPKNAEIHVTSINTRRPQKSENRTKEHYYNFKM